MEKVWCGMNDLFSIREEEIFKAIKWLKDYEFVLIGGYAVNAYTLPRFSVDCDIVLRDETELRKIEKNLLGIGYKKVNLPKEPSFNHKSTSGAGSPLDSKTSLTTIFLT